MPKSAPTEGPATARFVASLTAKERAQREFVLSLEPEERAGLPSRLRRLAADEATLAWAEAKAERDAAIAAVTERDEVTGKRTFPDPEAAAAARAEARDTWTARKAELAEG